MQDALHGEVGSIQSDMASPDDPCVRVFVLSVEPLEEESSVESPRRENHMLSETDLVNMKGKDTLKDAIMEVISVTL